MTFPPAFLALLESWHVDIDAFLAAYKDQIADKGYSPPEWLAKLTAIIDELRGVASDPTLLWAVFIGDLKQGYDADAGGVA